MASVAIGNKGSVLTDDGLDAPVLRHLGADYSCADPMPGGGGITAGQLVAKLLAAGQIGGALVEAFIAPLRVLS